MRRQPGLSDFFFREESAEKSTCGLAWYLGPEGSVQREEPAEPRDCGFAWYLDMFHSEILSP